MSYMRSLPNLAAFQQKRPNPKNQITRITPRSHKQLEKGEPVVQPATLGIVVILVGRYSFWEGRAKRGWR